MDVGDRLSRLSRPAKQAVMVATDLLILPLALWAAFVLRLGSFTPQPLVELWWLLLVLPLLSIPCLAITGLYRAVVRYMGPQALLAVVKGVTLSVLAFVAIVATFRLDGVPRTTFFLYWIFGLLAVGGTRFMARAWIQTLSLHLRNRDPVAIYGAGDAGVQLASSLMAARDYAPRLFIDDKPALQGTVIDGLKVYAPNELPALIARYGLTHVLLALPSARRRRRREIVEGLERLPVHIQTMPTVTDIVSGNARIDEIREVDIDDLLGRDAVEPSPLLLDHCIRDQGVMVTGAGGSIGSELCRQIIRRAPRVLVLLERSEIALYRIERELNALALAEGNSVRIVPMLGSVKNQKRMGRIMEAFDIQSVYHAAAYKHVPMVEANLLEGVQNNIFGTYWAAKAAVAAGVQSFVLVSTDKAVRPTNVMGATKRFAELGLQALAAEANGDTCFSMVRFGNVLDSSGSVVPLFREQIHRGGPVTVTHPDVTRYFMTISEAAALVIQAGSMARGGDVFVLDMGEPVRIYDLARRMIHLSGFQVKDEQHPDGDIEISFTGLRHGEKLYEELLLGDSVTETEHPMIMRAQETCLPLATVERLLTTLDAACREFDCERARDVLCEAVDGYAGNGRLNDLLWRRTQEPQGAKVVELPARKGG